MKKNKDGKNMNYRAYPFTHDNISIVKEKIKKTTGFNATSTEIIETSINMLAGMSSKSILEELRSFNKKIDNLSSKKK